MDANSRFEATISLVVTETKDGAKVPFCDCTMNYHDLPYDGLCLVEHTLVEALGKLNDAGVNVAMAAGLTERLACLMPQKMAALK